MMGSAEVLYTNTMALYPELIPLETHILAVGEEHRLYYEICGHHRGYPVLFLHGGPGSGCNPSQRRLFDPQHYRIILFDQRGCGRSEPLGSIDHNTTSHLIADIEKLRQQLDIEKWLVFGGSWGSTLALLYAVNHPQHVSGLILRGIFLARQQELEWFLGGVVRFYPDAWQTLLAALPVAEQGDVLTAYYARVWSDDRSVSLDAAQRWNAFEEAIMCLTPLAMLSSSRLIDPAREIARARVQLHYIAHACFIDGEALLDATRHLTHIPTHIIQGRYDMVCPPISAWELQRAMPHAQLDWVQAGHSAMDEAMTMALVMATDKFKGMLQAQAL